MSSYIFAFFFGLCVPLIASRFGKFLPTDPGTALALVWHKPRLPRGISARRRPILRQKWAELILYGVMWGILLMFAFRVSEVTFSAQAQIWLRMLFCILALLTAIDEQYFLLPDVLTVPLLFLGFGFGIFGGEIVPAASFAGALYGYLLPTVAVFVVHPFQKESFGGGDVKMLTALGAWFGLYGLNALLLVSVLSFLGWSIVKRKRCGAYGPHLAFGAVVTLFFVHFRFVDIF